MHNKVVNVLWVGRASYKVGLNLQKVLIERHHDANIPKDQTRNSLILIEHDPVYTVGIRNKSYTDTDVKKLLDKGAEFYKTNRGGLITFHGPGQLVAYPIIDLKQFQPSIRWYVAQIEKTIIRLCAELGIKGETSPDTGVWVNDRKICAIGIHGSRFITSHGLALNCNTDLKWFENIVPCGIEGKGVTSITQELHSELTTKEIIPLFKNAFKDQFQCELIDYPEGKMSELLRGATKNTCN